MKLLWVAVAVVCINLGVLASAQSLNPEVVWAMPKSARIKCITDVPGRMTVEYGTTPSLGRSSPPEWRDWPNTDVTRHYVNLLNLQPNTTYYYRVRITPQGGGNDLITEIKTFKTFRNIPKKLPVVRYSSYIIGSDWSDNDTNAPYHDWNAQHYDLDLAYSSKNVSYLKQFDPEVVATFYDDISRGWVAIWNESEAKWQDWADIQNISYENISLHYAVDTEVNVSSWQLDDTKFGHMAFVYLERGTYKAEPIMTTDSFMNRLPNKINEFIAIGHPCRFDAVYFVIKTPASGGWDGVWEYCNSVDANGKPISWAPLNIVEDTTIVNGQKLAQSGYVRFIPPKERIEWKRSRIYSNAADRDEIYSSIVWQKGFFIRFRITNSGTPPTFQSRWDIRHEDFSRSGPNGKPLLPGWDVSWETNPANNGDPEYNPNPPSSGGPGVAKSARFKWWSRVWIEYTNLRYLRNPNNPYYKQWWLDYWIDYIRHKYPEFDGIYCDNFTRGNAPRPPLTPSTSQLVEINPFNQDWQVIGMGELGEAISIKLTQMGWILSANDLINIAPFDEWYNPYTTNNPDLLWIYFVPAMANREITMVYRHSYFGGNISSLNTFFAEMAYRVYARGQYHVPMYAYTIATASSTNTQEWWEREKMRALAQYLLVREPEGEYLFLNAWHQNFFYGEFLTDPNTSVNRYYIAGIPKQKAYYIDASTLDFGQPITTVSAPYTQWVAYPNSWFPGVVPGLFVIHYTDKAPKYDSQGNYLGNTGRTWYFARRYTRALVVVRTGGSDIPEDSRGVNEYTAFDLDGYYYRLRSDGSIDPVPINRLNLLKHEGAVLIPAEGGPPPLPNIQITISVDKTNPKPLDVVTVRITATNTGNAEARNVRITHDIPQGATYVRGSLNLDGNALPDPTDTTRIDVTVASIPAGGQAVVVFQMVIR